MLGSVSGLIVSREGTFKCLASSTYANGEIKLSGARCKQWRKATVALSAIAELAPLDGKQWDCDADDGVDVYVEGVHDGRRFMFRVSNPGFCRDLNSERVSGLLRLL
jgi:hypothetical protein